MTKINDKYNYKKFSDRSPLMIFIHGAGCDNTFWAMLNRFIFLRIFNLAINLPGHGDNKEKGLSSIDEMALYVKKIVKSILQKKYFSRT